jgi:hypothetical protein
MDVESNLHSLIDQNQLIIERLDRIEKNIGALGVSVNSVVDTVNSFMTSAQAMLSSGALGKLGAMFGNRNGDENV